MLFPPLTRAHAHPDRALDGLLRERRRALQKMFDGGIGEAPFQHFVRGKRVGRILADYFWTTEQVGDMPQPLALCAHLRRLGLPTPRHGSSPSTVVKYTTVDAKFKPDTSGRGQLVSRRFPVVFGPAGCSCGSVGESACRWNSRSVQPS